MTWEEIKQSDKLWLTPDEVAPAIGKNAQDIRWQAHTRPELLGFPVSVVKTRTTIPRQPLITFFEGNADILAHLDRIESLLNILVESTTMRQVSSGRFGGGTP